MLAFALCFCLFYKGQAVCFPYHGSNYAADVNRVLALGAILVLLMAFTYIQQCEADVNNILLKLKQEHIISGNLA